MTAVKRVASVAVLCAIADFVSWRLRHKSAPADGAGVNSSSPLRERLGLAWHVLRRRPLLYRARINGEVEIVEPHTRVARCTVKDTATTPKIAEPSTWRHQYQYSRPPRSTTGGVVITGNHFTSGAEKAGA